MALSSFFSQLHSAYQSEIDDLSSDSEGSYVLPQRLAEKRKQMDFLVQMMTLSPEMVAVVFHKGFEFKLPAVMEHLLTLESEEFPDWHSLSDAVRLQPWANELASTVLKDPMGEWFLTAAAGLEYLLSKPSGAPLSRIDDDEEDEYEDDGTDGPVIQLDADDAPDLSDTRTREETAADWMEEQGFDRKD
jgi:hypothetical protein